MMIFALQSVDFKKNRHGRKRSAACVHIAYRTPMFATNVIDQRTPRFNICASGAERNMPLKPDMAIHAAIGRNGRERYRHLRRAFLSTNSMVLWYNPTTSKRPTYKRGK